MADYDLGTARGKIVVDHNDTGSRAAAKSLDYVSGAGARLTAQLKSLNNASKDSKLGFLHIQSGAQAAELAVRGLAMSLEVLDDTMNVVDRRIVGTAKIFGHRFLDMQRAAGDLSIAVAGVPKHLKWMPKEAQSFMRLTGAIGTAVFATNLLTKRTQTLGKVLSLGGKFGIVERGIHGMGGALNQIPGLLDQLRAKSPVLGFMADGLIKTSKASYQLTDRISNLALGFATLVKVGQAVVKLDRLERVVSRATGYSMTALGGAAALLQPILSGTSTFLLGLWDATKQLSGVANLLPAAIFSLAAPLAVAIMGFQNLGGAVEAALDPDIDPKKLDEATKNLAGNAKDMVFALRDVAPAWREVQKEVQGELFKDSAEGLRKLSDSYLPLAKSGFVDVANGLNEVTRGFTDFANQPRTVAALGEGLGHVANMLRNTGDAATPFMEAIREIGLVGTRSLEKYSGGLEGVAQKFADFMQTQAGADKVQGWIDNSITGFRDLGVASKALSDSFGNILRPFAGGDFDNALHRLSSSMQRFRDFTDSSGAGGKAIQKFATSLKNVAGPWAETFKALFSQVGNSMDHILPKVEQVSAKIAQFFERLINVAGPVVEQIARLIGMLSADFATLFVGITTARIALWAFKKALGILGPIFSLINALQALRRGMAGADGKAGVLSRSFNKLDNQLAKQAKKDAAIGRLRSGFFGMGAAAKESSRQIRDSAGNIGKALGPLKAWNSAGDTFGERMKNMSSAFEQSAKYAKQANPNLSRFGVVSKVLSANMGMAGRSVKKANAEIKDSAAQAGKASRSLFSLRSAVGAYRDAAEASTQALKDKEKAEKDADKKSSRRWGRSKDTVKSANADMAESTRNSSRSIREATRSMGASLTETVRTVGGLGPAFSDSMRYAKQASPELGRFGQAAKVMGGNVQAVSRSISPSFRSMGTAASSMANGFGSASLAAMRLGPAFAQSMRYAKQMHPEMSALSRASRVMGVNMAAAAGQTRALGNASSRMGAVLGEGATKAMSGARSAAGNLADTMGGGLSVAMVLGGAAAMEFYSQNKRLRSGMEASAKAATEGVAAQKQLRLAMAMSGGKGSPEATAAGMDVVASKIDQVTASSEGAATAFTGVVHGPLHRMRNSYDDLAKFASKSTNASQKHTAEAGMARLKMQAFNDALKETGLTMDEAKKAYASGGPDLDRLKTALVNTGSAGVAMAADLGSVDNVIKSAGNSVGDMGPRAAALSAAMSIITDAASSAEDRLNALRIALQSLGLMEDSAFDAAQDAAASINALADTAAGASTSMDAMGNSFLTASKELNPLHAGAGRVQDDLAAVRESILRMSETDPTAAMDMFENALPGLEALRTQLGIIPEEWQVVLNQMGLTPESVRTQMIMSGLDETEGALFAANEQLQAIDGKISRVTLQAMTGDAVKALEEAGVTVHEFDEKSGEAIVSVRKDESLDDLQGIIDDFDHIKNIDATLGINGDTAPLQAKIDESKTLVGGLNTTTGTATLDAANEKIPPKVLAAREYIKSVDQTVGKGTLDADGERVPAKVSEARGSIASLDSIIGVGQLDADGNAVPPKVSAADSNIRSLDNARGTGILDVIDNGIASKVAWAQAAINSIQGKTVYLDVIQRGNFGPLPSGAGTLAAATGATGGRFTGNSFNVPGYRSGGRHGGYRLPSQGPGTGITDGFLALDNLGAPVARLDKDEWVINGKSSKKWTRLLSAINRDDPRLKSLPKFAEGMSGAKAGMDRMGKSVHTVTQQINLAVNEDDLRRSSEYLAQISSEEFAEKFGKGAVHGLTLGSRDYFMEQGKAYADALGMVFGKAAEEANDRLKEEIDKIEDKNLKEQREKTIKSSEELQKIADDEMRAWVNNNQFEAMGYQMAKSFADGVSGGSNLINAGVDALAQTAVMALSAAGLPGLAAGLAVTAIKGLADALLDPDLWTDGLLPGIFKIFDRMTAGLLTGVLDIANNLTKIIGIDLSKLPIIGGLYEVKDAANGASKAVDKLLTDIEALNKLEYKNLGKTGATTIDAAIEAQLGNRVMDNRTSVAAGVSGDGGSKIGTMNVYAPSDRAGDILEAATFEMKRV